MTIQAMMAAKTASSVTITFPTPFLTLPTVLVTPYWKDSGSSVNDVETVKEITTTSCTIVSGNSASGYFVNVLAVDSGTSAFGSLPIVAGSAAKTQPTLTINFPSGVLSSPNPVTMLAPFWPSSSNGVGSVEILDNSSASECSVVSANAAPSNYYVEYVSTNIGMTTVDKKTLITGIANKTLNGLLRVYFPKAFTATPTVLLSSWWNDANSQVNGVDTLVTVNPNYFELTSPNGVSNYFVNWMAFGS